MAGVCSKCKISEMYKYWHELPATKHKFFKIMLGDFEYQLRFPNKFIECFKGELARECTLRCAGGNEWRVRIEKTEDDLIVMSDGWEIFVRDNGLKLSDFLTFRYLGNSSFKVSIFDNTGCEREGSHFAKNVSSSTCTSTLHPREQDPEDHVHNMQLPQAKQPQMYYTSNRRCVTVQEKKRAFELAMGHMKINKPSGVPMFVITICRSHVYKGFNLTIPKEWAVKHMLRHTHEVELQVPDSTEKWSVGCRWTPSQCQIRAKWPRFVLENTLEEHDVCVFELIQGGKGSAGRTNTVFMVRIFRVVDEVAPLTAVPRSVALL